MWAIEDSPGPKAAYRGGGIILLPAILLHAYFTYAATSSTVIHKVGHAQNI